MSAYKYYDPDSDTWKYLLQGPKGDKGDKGDPGTTDYNELTNKPTLGTAAATSTTDFATAAQGTKADTAVQKTGDTMSGDLHMSTDKAITLNTSQNTQVVRGLIRLKSNDNEAKAIIAYVDENGVEQIWLQSHNYLTYPDN